MEPILEVNDVSKSIKKKTLLSPLSFRVYPGECLSLCGGNGAGKSTLIRMISGLLTPTTGHIQINGKSRSRMTPQERSVFGYMPDHLLFPENMTALDILHFYGKLKGVPGEQVYLALDRVGLTEVARQRVGGFSKGMNQRLLFAQAILGRPRLLVMDEPTNGLDPDWVRTFENLIQTIKNDGTAILFSTHDLHVVEQVADRVIFLRDGRTLLNETVPHIQDEYDSVQDAFFSLK
ncbi:MAG: ABC transporter ATP-binding protein [Bacillaceae bacterium]|nr:ABC transporter ATP-binding protein [Bacillaceae bacterium]